MRRPAWNHWSGPGSGRARAARDGLVLAGLLFAGYLFLIEAPRAGTLGFDAYAYWNVNLQHPYTLSAGSFGAFPYTPVAARLFAPAHLLAWPDFVVIWLAILLGTAIWLGWRQALLVLAFPPVAVELYHGNVHLLIAAAIALGFRYPATWSFVLLTKVTPGVGLLWFAVRREWRQLAMALGATGALVVASLLIEGRLWGEWISNAVLPVADASVGQPHLAIPLLFRLPFAIVLVTWGALRGRRWTVPAAAVIGLPVLWFSGLAILAAVPAIARLSERPAAAGSASGQAAAAAGSAGLSPG